MMPYIPLPSNIWLALTGRSITPYQQRVLSRSRATRHPENQKKTELDSKDSGSELIGFIFFRPSF
jgi:hypothetical protein